MKMFVVAILVLTLPVSAQVKRICVTVDDLPVVNYGVRDTSYQRTIITNLVRAFAAAHVPAEVELYSTSQHGWCISDMPMQNGAPIYNKPDAERAWAKLLALYKSSLV